MLLAANNPPRLPLAKISLIPLLMKISYIICLFLAFLYIAPGCKKDTTATPGSMTVTIAGTAWTATAVSANYNTLSNVTQVTGVNTSTNRQVQIAFTGNTTGTYNFTFNDYSTYGSYSTTSGSDVYSTSLSGTPVGQIVITQYDKTNHLLSGTFHFDAFNQNDVKLSFTSGVFTQVPYTNQ